MSARRTAKHVPIGATHEARAFWITRPGRGEIRREEPPRPTDGRLIIRASHGAISRGTELLVYRGMVPTRLAQRMRCPFQQGDFPGPVKYGYSTVGTVIAGSEDLVGKAVFCLHPHQDVFAIPSSAARILPPRLPPPRAVLAANMETALNSIWDARVRRGDQVCVIGAGVVGLLTGYLARRVRGATVDIVDVDPDKAGPAGALGLTFSTTPAANRSYPVIFHASGAPDGLRAALEIAEFEGRIIEMSWYGTRPVSLPLGEDFHDRRLTIQASQVGSVSPSRRRRWSHARRLDRALELLRDPCLDALITGESRFTDLPQTMAALAGGRLAALCHRIVYS